MEIDETYDSFTLDNGFKVCYKSVEPPFSNFVEGRLRIRHGSIMEKKGEEGLWHFLEHILVSGASENYDTDAVREIRSKLPYINAGTSVIEMKFPFKVLPEQLPTFLDFISDKLFRHEIDIESIDRERSAILMETHDKKGKPLFEESKELDEIIYGSDDYRTYFVLGEEAVVASATKNDLKSIYNRLVHPDNMDIILVGGLPDNLENLINDCFNSVPQGNIKEAEIKRNRKIEGQTIHHISAPFLINKSSPENSNAGLSLVMYGPVLSEEDAVSSQLLVNILGERLYRSIREERGLAYSVGTGQSCTYLTGLINVDASVNVKNVDKTLDYIFEEMDNLRSEKISEKELKDKKEKIRTNFLIGKPRDYVGVIESNEDYGHSLSRAIRDLDCVTVDSVMLAAQKYLPDRKSGDYIISISDPLKEE